MTERALAWSGVMVCAMSVGALLAAGVVALL